MCFTYKNNIILHFPKCGGTTLHNECQTHQKIDRYFNPSHTGLFHVNKDINVNSMTSICILRDPKEFYVSLFSFISKYPDNPYNCINPGDFNGFLKNAMNINNFDHDRIDSFFKDWFSLKNKNFEIIKNNYVKGELTVEHPFINILMLSYIPTKLECGLMTLILIYLTAKDPMYIFLNFTLDDVKNNINNEKYFFDTVLHINLKNMDNVIPDLLGVNTNKHSNTSNIQNYDSFYSNKTKSIISNFDSVIYSLL